MRTGAPDWLEGLVLDGVISGVGGVLVFLPGLSILFLFTGLLEDTGYMARAAVVMDRFLHFLGLNGKSFVPMILGFGCAVPAIYATRTLDHQRDRILTALLVPLMSCAARLPVYVVFGLAFFAGQADLVVWAMYAVGILVAALAGLLFSRILFRGEKESFFVIELPPYRWPTFGNLWRYISTRTGDFIKNAGTVILLASMVIWLLLNIPFGNDNLQDSLFGQVSEWIAPVFKPAGFGSWEASGSLVTGLIAKEVVVSTMSQIYQGEGQEQTERVTETLAGDLGEIIVGFWSATLSAGRELLEVLTPGFSLFTGDGVEEDTSLSSALQTTFTPLSALAFMVFVLLYVPCVATLGAIRGEFGAKWAWFSALYQISVAWLLATSVYQVGRLLGYG
jgi:ferrous iron transport protein B